MVADVAAVCVGCGRPIGPHGTTGAAALELADGTWVHFGSYDCLIWYSRRRREVAQSAVREAFWRSMDLAGCGGCGAAIGPGERVYDYYDPKRGPEIVARVHSENLACLIAWNERWHDAEGHEHDAAFYRPAARGCTLTRFPQKGSSFEHSDRRAAAGCGGDRRGD